MEAHETLGNKWTDIARVIGGRTDNAVKNRFAALSKRTKASKSRSKRKPAASVAVPGVGVPGLPLGLSIPAPAGMGVPPMMLASPGTTPAGLSPGAPPSLFSLPGAASVGLPAPGAFMPPSMPLPTGGAGKTGPAAGLGLAPLTIPADPPGEPALGVVTAHVAREALTPAELNLIQEINAITPISIQIEDDPLTMGRVRELQRQFSARGASRLSSEEDVLTWFRTPRSPAVPNAFSGRRARTRGAVASVPSPSAPPAAPGDAAAGPALDALQPQHRSVLARVVQMSSQQREVLRRAQQHEAERRQTASLQREAAAQQARQVLEDAKEQQRRAEVGATEGEGGGPAAGGAEMMPSFASLADMSLGKDFALDDSLRLSALMPSIDEREMLVIQQTLLDSSVTLVTPRSSRGLPVSIFK